MPTPSVHPGDVFGRLTVIERVVVKQQGYYRCRCQCGNTTVVYGGNLKAGRSRSCGCVIRTAGGISKTSPTYKTWQSMRTRCGNPNHRSYPDYGGRGIGICVRWDSFTNFLADMGERPEGKTLDRIDPDDDYAPGNCRWATWRQQNDPVHHRSAFEAVCRNGHPRTAENTYVRPNGYEECRDCIREARRTRRALRAI